MSNDRPEIPESGPDDIISRIRYRTMFDTGVKIQNSWGPTNIQMGNMGASVSWANSKSFDELRHKLLYDGPCYSLIDTDSNDNSSICINGLFYDWKSYYRGVQVMPLKEGDTPQGFRATVDYIPLNDLERQIFDTIRENS